MWRRDVVMMSLFFAEKYGYKKSRPKLAFEQFLKISILLV